MIRPPFGSRGLPAFVDTRHHPVRAVDGFFIHNLQLSGLAGSAVALIVVTARQHGSSRTAISLSLASSSPRPTNRLLKWGSVRRAVSGGSLGTPLPPSPQNQKSDDR
jgi:hypothetical protein